MQFLYYLPDLIQFLLGFAAVVVASTWRKQPGKNLFIAFAIVAFLLVPALHLGASWAMYLLSGLGNYALYSWSTAIQAIFMLLNLVSGALLLCFAVVRLTEGSVPRTLQNSEHGENALALPAEEQWALNHGRRWETSISNDDLVSIARRREWGFLIDFSPIMFLVLGISLMASGSQIDIMRRIGEILVTISLVSMPFVLVYWVLKDCTNGVSVGKWITGCRVVDFRTGKPIGAGSSFLRNFVFLVPLMPLIELAVASIRSDRRRIGDLIAGTVVVKGPYRWFDGEEVDRPVLEQDVAPTRHPLDD